MPYRYFDPDSLAQISNLELVAREAVEGFLAGRHRSPYRGFSIEYLDHRAYSPGDEIRALDWKLLARTDKYYVKLFEDETNVRGYLLLDCSGSMAFRSADRSKLEYGSYLAAALSYLILRQNDAVGLFLFDRVIRHELAPRARRGQFRRLLELLEDARPGGETDLGGLLHELAERIRGRGLVVLISDLLDDVRRIAEGLQHFRHAGHEVIAFQVLDNAELTLPFTGRARFRDMETGGSLVAVAHTLRAHYIERISAFVEGVRNACAERGIAYRLANTSEPYGAFLAAYLEKRARLR